MRCQANFRGGFQTYAAAREYFEGTTPAKGRTSFGYHWDDLSRRMGTTCKPLGPNGDDRRKIHFSVRLGADEELIYRLYTTDVFTHHKDGRITLEGYCTQSTDAFVNQLCPDGLGVEYKVARYGGSDVGLVWLRQPGGNDYRWRGGWRGYQMDRKLTVKRGDERYVCDNAGVWEVTDDFKPETISVPFINRKLAREARKASDFNNFAAVLVAMAVVQGGASGSSRRGLRPFETVTTPSPGTLLETLEGGPEAWLDFAKDNMRVITRHPNLIVRKTMLALYNDRRVFDSKEIPYYESYAHYNSVLKARRMYE
jgi:hypothetical protein